MFHVTVFDREEPIRAKKGVGICKSNLKKNSQRKKAPKPGIELIVFQFDFDILTSIPQNF